MANPITCSGAAHAYLSTTAGISLRTIGTPDLPVTQKFLNIPPASQVERSVAPSGPVPSDAVEYYTPIDQPLPKAVKSKMEQAAGDGQEALKFKLILTGTEPKDTDPVEMIMAKRKKKELADLEIANAVLTASKLPPPPEEPNDVPAEIMELITMGLEREKCTTQELNFFRNYSLSAGTTLKSIKMKEISKYERFQKMFNGSEADRRRIYREDRKVTRQSSIHSDEDWFMESVLYIISILLVILTLPISLVFCLKVSCHVIIDYIYSAYDGTVDFVYFKTMCFPT